MSIYAGVKQIGKAALARECVERGSYLRRELNKIVHSDEKYGNPGEFNSYAQKIIDKAVLQCPCSNILSQCDKIEVDYFGDK